MIPRGALGGMPAAMDGCTIAQRVLQLVLAGRTTVSEAMKVISREDD